MRLLSFISEIEKAIAAESPMVDGGAWKTIRTINFAKGIAKVDITALSSDMLAHTGGSILVQAFALADGTPCLKVRIDWREGIGAPAEFSVFSTPVSNMKLDASRIGSRFVEGPPAGV